jgi:periplasmic divalent cation tolerance protein
MAENPTPSPDQFVVILVTVPDEKIAGQLAHALVEERLVACVNVLPAVRSIYAWKGEICNEGELLCLLKTRRALFDAVRERVLDLHPYEVPEVIALPLVEGSATYLQWLYDTTRPG